MTRDSRLLPLPAGDAVLQFRDRPVNRGAQRVIERLGVNIGARRDKVRTEPESRARSETPLDGHPGLIDPERPPEDPKLSLDQRGKRRRRSMMEVVVLDVHGSGLVCMKIFVEILRFDYYQVSHEHFH